MSVRPQWQWSLLGVDGERVDRPVGPVFTSRFDAEQWVGAHWRTLASQDVASAQLMNEGQPVGAVLDLTVE
ncbi:MAG: hypothetical protein KJ792_05900 [Actinobacteria bacterium]|nr:hypothetical protein [Actinomycetota bacterium]MCG2801502.1 hypothetical protein [Cellulomonas sp.]